jgi:hypothetical protein
MSRAAGAIKPSSKSYLKLVTQVSDGPTSTLDLAGDTALLVLIGRVSGG